MQIMFRVSRIYENSTLRIKKFPVNDSLAKFWDKQIILRGYIMHCLLWLRCTTLLKQNKKK